MDQDGTLLDTERLSTEGWYHAGQKMGYPMTKEQIWQFRGQSREDNCALFKSWFGPEALYWEVREVRTQYIWSYIDKYGVPLKEGLYEMLTSFRNQGLKTCLATGTARDAASKYWKEIDLLSYLDDTVCGNEVAHAKPDPEIFLRAAQKVGVPPEECLVLEDSPNGALAAHRAGSKLIIIPDETPANNEMVRMANYVVPSLFEVQKIVEEKML